MNGNQIFERFCKELERIGKTRKDFCDATGTSQSALSNWGKRGTMPSSDLVIAISEYLGCSTDYILGKSDVFEMDQNNQPVYAPGEEELLQAWRNADEKEKRMIVEMLAFFKNQKAD